MAIAADETVETDLPQMHINDLDAIADFVLHYVEQWHEQKTQQSVASDLKNSAAACCDTLSPAFLSVEQGREKILSLISPLAETESVAIQECYQRILAREVFSPINVPAYRNSAMDGYALRSDDLERDSYRVVAEVLAGSHYPKTVERGEAVKIMTGAPMPLGADTVVMREQATQNGELVSFAGAKIKAGQNVRQAGEDLAQGQAVFSTGQRLLSPEMGMLASLGFAHTDVFRSLKVAIFSTGDEVQAPGGDIEPNSIFDSNRFTLTGLLKQLGCQVIDLGIIEDDEAKMMQVLEQAAKQADMVITSGGVSVGDADFIKSALEKLGQIDFWRINMRPGRPLAFGQIAGKPFFGLPGNPVAVMVSFINFVEPALRKMQGEQGWQPLKVSAIALEDLRSRQGRTEFSRGVYAFNTQGQLTVRTTGKQGSGILRSMSEANCLIEIAPAIDTVKVGESVTIIPLQGRI